MRSTSKRIILGLWAFTGFYFCWPSFAWGYIDPATTSYLIQIVAGLVITLSVAFGVFFGKIRMVLLTMLARVQAFLVGRRGITATVQRPSALAVSATGSEHFATQLPHVVPVSQRYYASRVKKTRRRLWAIIKEDGLKNFLFAEQRPLRQRALIAALSSVAFAITYVLFVFLDRFIANISEMPYPIDVVLAPTLLLFGIVAATLLALLLLLRGRVFDAAVTVLVALTLAGYIQAGLLNMDFGKLNGTAITWADYGLQAACDLFFWVFVFVVLFVLHALRHKTWQNFVTYAAGLLIVVQLVSLTVTAGTTNLGFSGAINSKYLSYAGAYTVSTSQNQYVLSWICLINRLLMIFVPKTPTFLMTT